MYWVDIHCFVDRIDIRVSLRQTRPIEWSRSISQRKTYRFYRLREVLDVRNYCLPVDDDETKTNEFQYLQLKSKNSDMFLIVEIIANQRNDDRMFVFICNTFDFFFDRFQS